MLSVQFSFLPFFSFLFGFLLLFFHDNQYLHPTSRNELWKDSYDGHSLLYLAKAWITWNVMRKKIINVTHVKHKERKMQRQKNQNPIKTRNKMLWQINCHQLYRRGRLNQNLERHPNKMEFWIHGNTSSLVNCFLKWKINMDSQISTFFLTLEVVLICESYLKLI